MAWIKSYQELERHPKTMALRAAMGWDIDTTIGKLHRFWWWCLDYAPDGNIGKFPPKLLGAACDTDGEKFISAMIDAGFLDKEPVVRLHDWWEYAGEFLKGRMASKPEALKAIKDSYSGVTLDLLRSYSGGTPPQIRVDKIREDKTLSMCEFVKFWAAYPKKKCRARALEAWNVANPPIDKCLSTIAWQSKSEEWTKDGGRYIPNPADWLNDGRWDDVPATHEVIICPSCGHDGAIQKDHTGKITCGKCGAEVKAI